MEETSGKKYNYSSIRYFIFLFIYRLAFSFYPTRIAIPFQEGRLKSRESTALPITKNKQRRETRLLSVSRDMSRRHVMASRKDFVLQTEYSSSRTTIHPWRDVPFSLHLMITGFIKCQRGVLVHYWPNLQHKPSVSIKKKERKKERMAQKIKFLSISPPLCRKRKACYPSNAKKGRKL